MQVADLCFESCAWPGFVLDLVFIQHFQAEIDALIADVDARTSEDSANLRLFLAAERAASGTPPFGRHQ